MRTNSDEGKAITLMFLLFTACLVAIISLLLGGCVWPGVEVRSINDAAGLYQVTCYQNSLKCYPKAQELCPNGYRVMKTDVRRDTAKWYASEMCGTARARLGYYPIGSDCRNDRSTYYYKVGFSYDAFAMLVACN